MAQTNTMPQRVGGVLELLVEGRLRFVHALAVRLDVEPQLLHLLDLVLPRRDDHRHVGRRAAPPALLKFSEPVAPVSRSLRGQARQRASSCLHSRWFSAAQCRRTLSCMRQRGGLVDGHHHRLADEAAPEEVPHDVLRHGLQPVVAGDQVVLPAKLPFELGLLLGVELGVARSVGRCRR
jgi:hypothetical protein